MATCVFFISYRMLRTTSTPELKNPSELSKIDSLFVKLLLFDM